MDGDARSGSGRHAGGGRSGGAGRGGGGGRGLGRGPRDGSGRGLGRGADVVPPAIVARRPRPEVIVARPEQCTLCEACLDACRRGAIVLRESAEIEATICNGCGACIDACPNDVFATVGT